MIPVLVRVPVADTDVVRVEEEAELGVEGLVAVERGEEEERLEEPRGVGPVPLGGTHVGHRLHGLVLGGERERQPFGEVTGRTEPADQLLVVHRRQEVSHPRSFRTDRRSSGTTRAHRRRTTPRTYPEPLRRTPAGSPPPSTGGPASWEPAVGIEPTT